MIELLQTIVFLQPGDVPPNTTGLKVGDILMSDANRTFVRCGYRLGIKDAPECHLGEAYAAIESARGIKLHNDTRRMIDRASRISWMRRTGAGGPERGIHVSGKPCDCTVFKLRNKHTVRIGVYDSHGNDDGFDYSGPGLVQSRPVVVCHVECVEHLINMQILSGDAMRVKVWSTP